MLVPHVMVHGTSRERNKTEPAKRPMLFSTELRLNLKEVHNTDIRTRSLDHSLCAQPTFIFSLEGWRLLPKDFLRVYGETDEGYIVEWISKVVGCSDGPIVELN